MVKDVAHCGGSELVRLDPGVRPAGVIRRSGDLVGQTCWSYHLNSFGTTRGCTVFFSAFQNVPNAASTACICVALRSVLPAASQCEVIAATSSTKLPGVREKLICRRLVAMTWLGGCIQWWLRRRFQESGAAAFPVACILAPSRSMEQRPQKAQGCTHHFNRGARTTPSVVCAPLWLELRAIE